MESKADKSADGLNLWVKVTPLAFPQRTIWTGPATGRRYSVMNGRKMQIWARDLERADEGLFERG